jgi:hypothetical protein
MTRDEDLLIELRNVGTLMTGLKKIQDERRVEAHTPQPQMGG